MQIILMSRHLKTAKTITIMPQHVLVAVAAFFIIVVATSATFSWLSVEFRLPLVQDLMASLQRKENQKTQEVMSNNLQLMATRLGELQAQVLQLDSLGERLSSVAGVNRGEVQEKTRQGVKPGEGGPLITPRVTYGELQQEIDRLSSLVEYKTDEMTMLESRLLEKRVRERLLPTTQPVKGASIGSAFGYRSDPIAGVRAMHEGLDFHAEA
ncbi:MAG: M23 family peptidase, partial [Betaproteobacteria bacterium]